MNACAGHGAVRRNIKYTTAALDEFSLHTELRGDTGRQTGGSWQVISTHAILDGDAHGKSSVKIIIIAEEHRKFPGTRSWTLHVKMPHVRSSRMGLPRAAAAEA